jgi:hypothetical protein
LGKRRRASSLIIDIIGMCQVVSNPLLRNSL